MGVNQNPAFLTSRLLLSLLFVGLSAGPMVAQDSSVKAQDERAIRVILDNQIRAWNAGDAAAHGRDLDDDIIYTNNRGQTLKGAKAVIGQHAGIFQSIFRNTVAQQDIEELQFPVPDVAVVHLLTSISGLAQMPPGALTDAKGRLRTKLLQVMVRRGGQWKIVAYHNVDVKPGVPVPEPGAK